MQEAIERAGVLVEALPYIQHFRNRTVVIKYGGSAMESPELMECVLRDVVLLEAVGINPVIVHGGGKAISRRLQEKGIEARWAHGLRITDEPTVAIVEEVLDTVINPDIVAKLNAFGGRAESVSGRNVFRARKAPPRIVEGEEVDLGYVGEVEGCIVGDILHDIRDEIVPVLSPIGRDRTGQTYNINADVAATEVAICLKASKLIFLSDVSGILRDKDDPSSLISHVNESDIESLKAEGVVSGGMIPKVDSCLKALHEGVGKVHLIDGRIHHSLLLELLTDTGVGTEIVLR